MELRSNLSRTFADLLYSGIGTASVGKTIFVDSVNGNDSTGTRGDASKPFLTVGAALAATGITTGDVVFVRPGTYNLTSGITLPTGVTLRGASVQAVTIQMTGVVANTTLVTMGVSSRVEDVALNLTSTGHFTLTGVLFPSTTSATAKVRDSTITVDNSGAGAGTSTVTGVLVQSTGTPTRSNTAIRATTVTVNSANLGTKRGILQDTLAGNFHIRDTNVVVTRTGAGGSYIGAEVNVASALMSIDSGNISGPDADISQTAGTFECGCILLNATANTKFFTAIRSSSLLEWGQDGLLVGNSTRFMVPGTGNSLLTEVQLRIARPTVIKSLSMVASSAPGAAKTDTVTVRKNGVDTILTTSLAGAVQTANTDTTNSVTFTTGDLISMKLVTAIASGTSDLFVTVEVY